MIALTETVEWPFRAENARGASDRRSDRGSFAGKNRYASGVHEASL